MDHRPFEDWLLNHQVLDADETRQLNAHLQGCISCTALAEVNLALKSARMAAPTTGFSDRFQVRLEARKQALRRRNFLGFALLMVSVAGLMACLAWPLIHSLLESPVNLLASWLTSLLSLYTVFQAMAQAGVVFSRVVPGFIPAYVWMIILFAGCGWSLVWLFSVIKFSKLVQGG